jgi:uncharacterized protein
MPGASGQMLLGLGRIQVEKLISETMNGNLLEVREVIEDGADVNSVNRLGVTPLMVACQWNQPEIARFLLDLGAALEPVERSCGRNALMYACLSGNVRLIKLLLEKGAGIDSTDHMGRTPLMMASSVGKTEIVKLLIECGANIHLRDKSGLNALEWASDKGRGDIVELLWAKGAVGQDYRIRLDETLGS